MEAAGEGSRRETLELGELSALIDGPDLRYVTWGGIEIVRRAFVTVRDEDWDTPELELGAVRIDRGSRSRVSITVEAAHLSATIDTDWKLSTEVGGEGTIRSAVRFLPRRSFSYSRMGLCVLFPPSALIGSHYRAWAGESEHTGTFGAAIAPQLVHGEEILPLFPAFDRIRIQVDGVGMVEAKIAGDLFEMEDQRNWSDDSFKAYCTPLSRPRPQVAHPENAVSQEIEITVTPSSPQVRGRRGDRPPELIVGSPTGTVVPALGTVLARPLGERESWALGMGGLEHLRVDARHFDRLAADLEEGAAAASRAGVSLMPALFLPDDDEALDAAADVLASLDPEPLRILAFAAERLCEQGRLTQRLRSALGERLAAVKIGGGTDAWFVDLNRARPEPGSMQALAWSITPQVHSRDPLTMFEGIAAQGDQVRTARQFAPGLELIIGPVTLRPRYNPNAADAREQALCPPAASVDPRQKDGLAAAWSLGSLATLAMAGADVVTYFEATGPRGLMSTITGDPYPVWKVVSMVAALTGRSVLAVGSSDPLAAVALAIGGREETTASALLIANLRGHDQMVIVRGEGLTGARIVPLTGDSPTQALSTDRQLELGPYAVVEAIPKGRRV